jgi:PaREP1/PaREP8 domain containing family protein
MEELVKRASELDIDIEDLIITAISRSDPSNGLRLSLSWLGVLE